MPLTKNNKSPQRLKLPLHLPLIQKLHVINAAQKRVRI